MKKLFFCSTFLLVILYGNAQKPNKEKPKNRVVATNIGQTGFQNQAVDVNSYNQKKKGVKNKNRSGNFEIQDLMNQYNQAEKMQQDIRKKKEDSKIGIIGKIG